jgi:hypothetical protein
MREKHVYYAKRVALSAACGVIAILVMGLFGCTNDNPSHGNANGISAPVPQPEGGNYTITRNRASLILGGVSSQNGVSDSHCGIDITVTDGMTTVVDAPCELRWNVSDYPNRSLCSSSNGTTYSLSGGVYHVYATTDAYGIAHFRVAGTYDTSTGCGGGEGSTSTPRKVKFFVEGVEQTISGGWCNVSVADLNASGGVNSADLSIVVSDNACSNYYSRSDLDGDGDVDDADEDILEGIIFGGGSTASCGF